MTTLTLILTLRPRDAIIINEDKQQSAMSEVDLKSKVSCFLPKSPQVVLGTSHRLEVDLGSFLYRVGSDWHTKVAPRSNTVLEFHTEAPQATVSEVLSQGHYVAARAESESTSLRTKGIDSTHGSPHNGRNVFGLSSFSKL